ncbi:MAG TPA: O-phosphoseryl-tRNA(Sec) selenium transferase [Candidatus Bathyarchaeia archaeon]
MSDLETLLKGTVPDSMLKRGVRVLRAKLKPIRILFEQRKVPDEGWDDEVIDLLLTVFSLMDTDKDPDSARIGEREARVASLLVSDLAHGFCHGVGRSGNVVAPQPKAAGASLAYFFANKLALNMLQKMGAPNLKSACVIPVATGMGVGFAASVARDMTSKREVVYARLDHLSPVKGIQLVGMKMKTVESDVFGDAVRVPVERIKEAVSKETAAIVSTTTFFPPREPDDVKAIAKLALGENIPHIINNAYGVQSKEIMKLIHGAIDAGRVDAVIQSTDKNFLTPVGGCIIASPDGEFIDKVSKAYAGRASAAPIIQFLAAILSLGLRKYEELRSERERNRELLGESLQKVAKAHDERVLKVFNPIAAAMTLNNYNAKKVGYNLYTLRVTGPRVLEKTDFGTCCKRYHSSYITINAAIGSTSKDISLAMRKLDKALGQAKK